MNESGLSLIVLIIGGLIAVFILWWVFSLFVGSSSVEEVDVEEEEQEVEE